MTQSSKGSGVEIGSEMCPNQEVETQVYIHFPTTECYLILVIQVQECQV